MPKGVYIRTKQIWNKGLKGVYHHSEKTCAKIKKNRKGLGKGRKLPEETKKKISVANKGKPCFWKGKKLPKETRDKISKNHFDCRGKNHPNWKGGRHINSDGYVWIFMSEHPFAKSNYILEHHIVIEKYIGRYLKREEVVHHINKIKGDNRIENLMVFKNHAYHIWFHKRGYCNSEGMIFDGRKEG